MSEFEDKNYPSWNKHPVDKESQDTLKRIEVRKPKCVKCGDSGWVEECRTVWMKPRSSEEDDAPEEDRAIEKESDPEKVVKSASTCGFSWWHVRCDGEAHKDEIFMGEREHRIMLGEDTKKRSDVVSFG